MWPSDTVKSPVFFKPGSCFSFFRNFLSFYLFYFNVFSVFIIILYNKNKVFLFHFFIFVYLDASLKFGERRHTSFFFKFQHKPKTSSSFKNPHIEIDLLLLLLRGPKSLKLLLCSIMNLNTIYPCPGGQSQQKTQS